MCIKGLVHSKCLIDISSYKFSFLFPFAPLPYYCPALSFAGFSFPQSPFHTRSIYDHSKSFLQSLVSCSPSHSPLEAGRQCSQPRVACVTSVIHSTLRQDIGFTTIQEKTHSFAYPMLQSKCDGLFLMILPARSGWTHITFGYPLSNLGHTLLILIFCFLCLLINAFTV